MKAQSRAVRVLGFMLTVAVATGCGQPEPEEAIAQVGATELGLRGSFPDGFDPCALVSEEEAERAAGEAIGSVESEISRFGIATCTFEPADGLMPPVVLEVRPDEGAYEMALGMASSPDPVEPLEGVGDRAFYSTLLGHNIVLVSGGRYANLIVRTDPQADNRDRAIDLAGQVAERLR